MNYKTYAEAKIANPDSEIVTTDKRWSGCDDVVGYFGKRMKEHRLGDDAWVICNPADYCSSLKEFLESGFKLGEGDKFIGIDGVVVSVNNSNSSNIPNYSNANRYILSAAALNGGCKILAKAEQWSIYNNTLQLCELTDEQAAMLFNAWRGGSKVQFLSGDKEWKVKGCNSGFYHSDIYRIKPKSERELFIDKSKLIIGATTDDELVDAVIADLFDAGARYTDLTQHFGENI